MDKYIYDEKNGLWYELQGDYYLPYLNCLKKKRRISAYGDSGIWILCSNRWIFFFFSYS